MKRELIVNSAAGVYSATAAAYFLVLLEANGEAVFPDPADLATVKEIAERGDDAPEHYIEDMETLEQVVVFHINGKQAFIAIVDGDVWLLHD